MTVTIGRREVLAALGGAACAWPLVARAQQPAMMGFLSPGSLEPTRERIAAMHRGLADAWLRGGAQPDRRIPMGRRSH